MSLPFRHLIRQPEIMIAALVGVMLVSIALLALFQLGLIDHFGEIGQSRGAEGPVGRLALTGEGVTTVLPVPRDLFGSAVLQIGFAAAGAVLLALLAIYVSLRHRTLHEMANYDPLTGLANRGRFQDLLPTLIKDPGPGNDLALMIIDVDHFKHINDGLGHDVGDAVLMELGNQIRKLPHLGLWAARLGGDEFAIIVAAPRVVRHARFIAETLLKSVEQPFAMHGKKVKIGLSLGISYLAQGAYSMEGLLKNADVALYAAKLAGRGTFRVFSPKLDTELKTRIELEGALRQAIARNELELHFQPIVDLQSVETVGYEALARWNHPRLGQIPPQQFIKVAEATGEMRSLGDWIIRKACMTARSWPDEVGVSINLSPQQFEGSGLLSTVEAVIAETGIRPGRIEFEITESLLINDKDHVADLLRRLRNLGVRIALDDFGTGYSSMSYLHQFPIDKIKIDQSFVRDMATRPEAAAIVESISFLARKLGLVTTAEGIETEAQALFVRSMGCHEGQGYYFARPFPAESCESWLQQTTGQRPMRMRA